MFFVKNNTTPSASRSQTLFSGRRVDASTGPGGIERGTGLQPAATRRSSADVGLPLCFHPVATQGNPGHPVFRRADASTGPGGIERCTGLQPAATRRSSADVGLPLCFHPVAAQGNPGHPVFRRVDASTGPGGIERCTRLQPAVTPADPGIIILFVESGGGWKGRPPRPAPPAL